MTASFLLFISIAFGSDLHTGVPVSGIDGLGVPRFQTVDTGWMATVPNGFVRVYVGSSRSDADRWVNQRLEKLAASNPAPNQDFIESFQVEEAYGDGKQLLIFRSKNVAVCARSKVAATPWAEAILKSIVDIPYPWPTPPSLSVKDEHWVINAPSGSKHIAYVGGVLAPSASLKFVKPPYRVIAWDHWGRAAWTEVAVP